MTSQAYPAEETERNRKETCPILTLTLGGEEKKKKKISLKMSILLCFALPQANPVSGYKEADSCRGESARPEFYF